MLLIHAKRRTHARHFCAGRSPASAQAGSLLFLLLVPSTHFIDSYNSYRRRMPRNREYYEGYVGGWTALM